MSHEISQRFMPRPFNATLPTWMAPALLTIAILFAMLASLCIGVYPVPLVKVMRIVGTLALPFPVSLHASWTLKEQIVVEVVRLPRVLLATMSGLGLGICGAALQGMLRNPLVSPDIIGVSSGAACGCLLGMLFDFPVAGAAVLGFGMIGGLLALTCTLLLAKLVRGGTIAVVLAGMFVGAFFTALIGIIEYCSDALTQLPTMLFWLLGSFVGADPSRVAAITIPTLGAGAVMMMLRWRINLLSLDDLDATSLGFNASYLRWVIIVVVSVIIAAQVAVCGVIGWVGLVVPHFARMLVGPDHRRLLPVSALLGGLFTLGIDDISRTLFPQEIPVGLLTAAIGTPIICFLFWKTQTKGWISD